MSANNGDSKNSTENQKSTGDNCKNENIKPYTQEEALKVLSKHSYENFSLHDRNRTNDDGKD